MWKYRDIETGETVTLEELKQEYLMLADTVEEQTFDEYLENCLTRNNGTLEIIYK